MVVGSDREADFVIGELIKFACDRFLGVSNLLVNVRSMKAYVTLVGRKQQVAGISIDVRGCAREAHRDLVWVSSRSYAEVILELSLIAVVNEVDSGIHALVLDASELWNVGVPL